jgi:gluconokinase
MASGAPLTDEDRGPWLEALHALISERNAGGQDGILACSALKDSYRRRLAKGNGLAVVYLRAEPGLIRSRLAGRRGHYMPASLIDSQFTDLEEPKDGITLPAAWPPDRIVLAIRAWLGR